jgi:hypothetical protein
VIFVGQTLFEEKRDGSQRKGDQGEAPAGGVDYDVSGVTIVCRDGEWFDSVDIKIGDFADNHEMKEYCFINGDHLAIFATDRLLKRGPKVVYSLLKEEAERLWVWQDATGEVLQRMPTGLEAALWFAATLLWGASIAKVELQATYDFFDFERQRPI